MDKVWGFKVKVPSGYQWWAVAYEDEPAARKAMAGACDDGIIVEAKQVKNGYNLRDRECRQLPDPWPAN